MAKLFNLDKVTSLPEISGSSCAFGVFDGYHKGHRFIVEQTIENARDLGVDSYIITFDIDPDEYFDNPSFKKIMSNKLRIKTLLESGVSGVVVLNFDAFHNLESDSFLDQIFINGAPGLINVGRDVRFGKLAAGSLDTLESWGSDHGMQVEGYDLITYEGTPITSSRIRELLLKGCVTQANDLLGHRYQIDGTVIHGRGDGADMGFKTANIQMPENLLTLSDGVYAAIASVGEKDYKAAVSVGIPPTFQDSSLANIEVHILDFEGDLYGDTILTSFVSRIRDMIKFPNIESLIAQVNSDIDFVRETISIT